MPSFTNGRDSLKCPPGLHTTPSPGGGPPLAHHGRCVVDKVEHLHDFPFQLFSHLHSPLGASLRVKSGRASCSTGSPVPLSCPSVPVLPRTVELFSCQSGVGDRDVVHPPAPSSRPAAGSVLRPTTCSADTRVHAVTPLTLRRGGFTISARRPHPSNRAYSSSIELLLASTVLP
jgi:hypothetical protein